ncbi:MAG: amino acid adenylation domain-containing protein [Chitinophagaceae bacterium]|nr:amino acid adenylation domain-containing protein [Chitinophagaceae bacterium]
MNISQIIQELKRLNIIPRVDSNDQLKLSGETGRLTPDFIAIIKSEKKNIISFLKSIERQLELAKIPFVKEESSYPISHGQKRIWSLSQTNAGKRAYNIATGFYLKGALSSKKIEYAINSTIQNHESLRTVFREIGGEIRQVIKERKHLSIQTEDLNLIEDKRKYLDQEFTKELNWIFDLGKWPLIRVRLFRLSDKEHAAILCVHHIISDGWSISVFWRDVMRFYSFDISNDNFFYDASKIQYKEFVNWQNEELNTKSPENWQNILKAHFFDLPEPLNLPTDFSRPERKTFEGASLKFYFQNENYEKISSYCLLNHISEFNFFLSALSILLYRLTGQGLFMVGTVVAGRNHFRFQDVFGLFVNSLPIKIDINVDKSFRDLQRQITHCTFSTFLFQDYPFDQLIDDLNVRWDLSRSPLFDVLMVFHDYSVRNDKSIFEKELEIVELDSYLCKSSFVERNNVTSKFDLTFNFKKDVNGRFFLEVEYSTKLFKKEKIFHFFQMFSEIISNVISHPDLRIGNLEIVTPREKVKVLEEFNATAYPYPEDRTVVDLFEEQVLRTPEKIALVYEDRQISYRELNEHSNRLAGYLREEYKIQSEDLVGIQLERSEWMVIAILGVLKSGGAYVPIDPEYPQERIDYMLDDSKCRVVIDAVELKKFRSEENKYRSGNPVRVSDPENLAYVIYTSGSTGKPKGCMLEHSGIINRLNWMWKRFDFTTSDTILQKTPITFDVSVWELFLPLCWGAKMILCKRDESRSTESVFSLIVRHKVTCLHFVPSMLASFVKYLFDWKRNIEDLKSLRCVIASGEALSVATVKEWYKILNIPLCNLYGPTEASIDVTYHVTSLQDTIVPIGRPIWNTEIYILSEDGLLQPVGVSGEICIGGKGLARGYLNRPELTEEKFVPNPYRPGERMYRTGDIGRWMADGNIEFLGRRDDQVKIRGYRIELGEIESVVQGYEGISSSVVVVRSNAEGDKELVCYVISSAELKEEELRLYLRDRLPQYMIPLYFVQLESLPLTANGKINRNRLPAPHESSGVEYIAPRTEIEQKLSEIWSEVLGKERIGVRDDFFQLGGHSLKATRLLSRINQVFLVRINMESIYKEPTIENISEQILFWEEQKKIKENRERLIQIEI